MGGSFTCLAEGVYEVRNKIFFFGAGFEDLFFIFYDDFIVGNFDDFFSRND